MKEAKISDIFLSIQGEGPYAGAKQLFVRFYGCNMKCSFCDTALSGYRTFTANSLMSRILGFGGDYEHLTFTGGEPLMQADFLRDFLKGFKAYHRKPVYLETNGVLADALGKVLRYVDIISMDFKIPSSTGLGDFSDLHRAFIKKCGTKNIFIKAVLTDKTTMQGVKKMAETIAGIDPGITMVLQPATPLRGAKAPEAKRILNFWKESVKILRDVRIIPQLHEVIGVK